MLAVETYICSRDPCHPTLKLTLGLRCLGKVVPQNKNQALAAEEGGASTELTSSVRNGLPMPVAVRTVAVASPHMVMCPALGLRSRNQPNRATIARPAD